MLHTLRKPLLGRPAFWAGGLVAVLATALTIHRFSPSRSTGPPPRDYRPHLARLDSSGFTTVMYNLRPWDPDASLEDIRHSFQGVGERGIRAMDQTLAGLDPSDRRAIDALLMKAILLNHEGQPRQAYEVLGRLRSLVEDHDDWAEQWLFTVIYYQGITALRCGETENCILCRGESSCILPIAPAAVHTNPLGSRQAIGHFTEYLGQFPDDFEVRWLLNLAQMTLGEYPDQVNPAFLISLEPFRRDEFPLGRFRDVGERVGLNRFNQAGGAIMDDFDNDGLLDIVVTTVDPTQPMAFYRNKGDGTFEERTKEAGLLGQLGGLNCVQTDYNNDGRLDIFIPRGAWYPLAMRPTLLRNNGDGTFTDVTKEAGLLEAVNSNSASWADYDNDGFLDLFVCCERQPCRLYHNKGDGTFEEVADRAGIRTKGFWKGCAWIDYDNDGYPDLFLNNMAGPAQLFHNNRDGTFSDVTASMGIDGPNYGFSCWAWDFDNDGWLDLFATSYDGEVADAVKGMLGQPHKGDRNRLYRNLQGKGFQDVTKEAGLDRAFLTMGSNFGDFDGDGYLDLYLSTGGPQLSWLVPNRLFKNDRGQRFTEATTSSGTGHLQKGHGVACGDWRRNGNIDLFIEMGGQTPGDRYHNVLFRNPGHGNNWLTVKLVGKKTNRPAIGARIKVVTAADQPLTVHRHVSSGSSFGANPLQQTIGLGKADRVASLEITWPTSGTTQVFHDLAVNQAIEVTEFARDYRNLDWKAVALPE